MLIAGDMRAFISSDMRNSIDGLSYLVQPLAAQNALLCGEAEYVAADRNEATKRLISWSPPWGCRGRPVLRSRRICADRAYEHYKYRGPCMPLAPDFDRAAW